MVSGQNVGKMITQKLLNVPLQLVAGAGRRGLSALDREIILPHNSMAGSDAYLDLNNPFRRDAPKLTFGSRVEDGQYNVDGRRNAENIRICGTSPHIFGNLPFETRNFSADEHAAAKEILVPKMECFGRVKKAKIAILG